MSYSNGRQEREAHDDFVRNLIDFVEATENLAEAWRVVGPTDALKLAEQKMIAAGHKYAAAREEHAAAYVEYQKLLHAKKD